MPRPAPSLVLDVDHTLLCDLRPLGPLMPRPALRPFLRLCCALFNVTLWSASSPRRVGHLAATLYHHTLSNPNGDGTPEYREWFRALSAPLDQTPRSTVLEASDNLVPAVCPQWASMTAQWRRDVQSQCAMPELPSLTLPPTEPWAVHDATVTQPDRTKALAAVGLDPSTTLHIDDRYDHFAHNPRSGVAARVVGEVHRAVLPRQR